MSGGAELITDSERTMTYYNLNLGYNILPGEVFIGEGRAYNTNLYLIAGLGSTRLRAMIGLRSTLARAIGSCLLTLLPCTSISAITCLISTCLAKRRQLTILKRTSASRCSSEAGSQFESRMHAIK